MTPYEDEPIAGLPRGTVRSEAVHLPPTRTARAHDVRPATELSAERGDPPDAGGGSRALPCRRASCGAPRTRRPRRLVETRRIPEGAPGDSACPPVPPRREPGELRETVRSVICRGAGGRARHLWPRGRSKDDPREVRLGRAIPRPEPRAARRLHVSEGQHRRRRGAGRVHLKSGGSRSGIPSLISYR